MHGNRIHECDHQLRTADVISPSRPDVVVTLDSNREDRHLRESLEEMRLNPLLVKFLGPLPPQRLEMFHRVIYPMAGWITGQKRFFPNWEVEKIVYIRLRDLLNEDRYACYRLQMETRQNSKGNGITQDFPCFLHQNRYEREVLWGATYRIITVFLELVFGFSPPPMENLPVIEGALADNYLTGTERY